jgi:hypothetical protein
MFSGTESGVNSNNDKALNTVSDPVLPLVDLFSDLHTDKGTEFRKENELTQNQNAPEVDTLKLPIDLPGASQEKTVQQKNLLSLQENSSSKGQRNLVTKSIVKIVEFYSDQTYREYYPE